MSLPTVSALLDSGAVMRPCVVGDLVLEMLAVWTLGVRVGVEHVLGWSTYWGPNYTALANKLSPNAWTDAPPSPVGTRGDLDRFGNQIRWNTADAPLPRSV